MTQRHRALWLQAALLLLWALGSLSVSGPSKVTGTVGGSLSVQCHYKKKFTENKKYWCKSPCLPLSGNIVETTKLGREASSGRVSIRDHPANLTFTVTLENLTEGDEGTYSCGVDVPLWVDSTSSVVVSVSPATPSKSTTSKSKTTSKSRTSLPATTSTITAKISTASIASSTEDAISSPRSQDDPLGSRLLLLLGLLALLLLLGLVGVSLLAWRMVQRRVKAGENPEPLEKPSQAAQQSEPCYGNLELQTWALLEDPVRPCQEEVEYSTVEAPREEPQYSTVTFHIQNEDCKDQIPPQRAPQLEPEYSVIKKTT